MSSRSRSPNSSRRHRPRAFSESAIHREFHKHCNEASKSCRRKSYKQAYECYKQAIECFELSAHPNPSYLAGAYQNAAFALAQSASLIPQDIEIIEKYYTKAINIYETTALKSSQKFLLSQNFCSILENLTDHYRKVRRWIDAAAISQRTIDIASAPEVYGDPSKSHHLLFLKEKHAKLLTLTATTDLTSLSETESICREVLKSLGNKRGRLGIMQSYLGAILAERALNMRRYLDVDIDMHGKISCSPTRRETKKSSNMNLTGTRLLYSESSIDTHVKWEDVMKEAGTLLTHAVDNCQAVWGKFDFRLVACLERLVMFHGYCRHDQSMAEKIAIRCHDIFEHLRKQKENEESELVEENVDSKEEQDLNDRISNSEEKSSEEKEIVQNVTHQGWEEMLCFLKAVQTQQFISPLKYTQYKSI